MSDLVSSCCRAPVRTAQEQAAPDPNWVSQWYECTKCGKEVDPVKEKAE